MRDREKGESGRTRDGTAARFQLSSGGQAMMESTQKWNEGKLGFDCLPLTGSGECFYT